METTGEFLFGSKDRHNLLGIHYATELCLLHRDLPQFVPKLTFLFSLKDTFGTNQSKQWYHLICFSTSTLSYLEFEPDETVLMVEEPS